MARETQHGYHDYSIPAASHAGDGADAVMRDVVDYVDF